MAISKDQAMAEPEQGRQVLSGAELQELQRKNSELMAQVGLLPAREDPTWESRALGLVGKGVARICSLCELRNERLDWRGAQGRGQRGIVEKMTGELIRCFSEVALPDAAEGRRLRDILMHYRAEYLDDDAALAKNFEAYRAEYRKNPADADACIRYGWLLHDCLKAASRRLHNVKLTEFFQKAFSEWKYEAEGTRPAGLVRLEAVRQADLRRAETFLNGPREALELAAHGKWEQALAAARGFLESNPGNEAALKIALEACEGIGNVNAYVDMFNFCVNALDWYPDEAAYQRKLVYAARKFLGGLKLRIPASALTAEKTLSWVRNGCGQVVTELNGEFARLKNLERKTWDYSSVLFTATQAFAEVMRFKLADEVKLEYATAYAGLVEKWDVRNFRDDDLKDGVGEHRWLSLAGRVALALLACAELGVAHAADGWLMRFVAAAAGLFKRDPSRYLHGLCRLRLVDGDPAAARRCALDLVRWNQSEGWRWRVLGTMYPKGSQERADCFAHAQTRDERLKMAEAAQSLRSLFDGTVAGKMTPQEVELHQRQSAEADARAEALLLEGAKVADGVVLTWFTDRPSGKEVIRVWWRDGQEAYSDFVEFRDVQDLERSAPGTPVRVAWMDVGGRTRVVKVAPRPGGACWDIYPFAPGIVAERNEGRQFAKILYAPGRFCSVDLRKHPIARDLACGASCELAIHEREGLAPLTLAVRAAPASAQVPGFCRTYQGELKHVKKGRDGQAADVRIPVDVRAGARFGREVHGLAVDCGKPGDPAWRAVTCRES